MASTSSQQLPVRGINPVLAGARSLPILPAELRIKIWQHAMDEPTRIVMLGLSAVFAQPKTAGTYVSDRISYIPVSGEFTIYKNNCRENPNSIEAAWPDWSQNTIRNLSLVSTEARNEVVAKYPEVIRASTFFLPTSQGGVSRDPEQYCSLRCNLNQDIFLLDLHDALYLSYTSDADFWHLLDRRGRHGVHVDNVTFNNSLKQLTEAEEVEHAAQNENFRRQLKSMRQIAIGTFLRPRPHHVLPLPERHYCAKNDNGEPLLCMAKWMTNLEIMYYLPPHVAIGKNNINAVRLHLDDVWRPSAGLSARWTNPHDYIRLHRWSCSIPETRVGTRVLNASAVEAERLFTDFFKTHGSYSAMCRINRRRDDLRDLMEDFVNERLEESKSYYAASRPKPTVVEYRDAARRGELPTAGLLLPGNPLPPVDIEMRLIDLGRAPGSRVPGNPREPDWEGDGSGHTSVIKYDYGPFVPVILPQYLRFKAILTHNWSIGRNN